MSQRVLWRHGGQEIDETQTADLLLGVHSKTRDFAMQQEEDSNGIASFTEQLWQGQRCIAPGTERAGSKHGRGRLVPSGVFYWLVRPAAVAVFCFPAHVVAACPRLQFFCFKQVSAVGCFALCRKRKAMTCWRCCIGTAM